MNDQAVKWKMWTGPCGVKEAAQDLESVPGVTKVLAGTEHVYFNHTGEFWDDLANDPKFPASVKCFLKGDTLKKMSR
jgi:hypothetical protein